jgi:hypothetical protein
MSLMVWALHAGIPSMRPFNRLNGKYPRNASVDIRLGNHPENGTSHKAQECEQNPKPRRHIFLKEAKKGERSV